MTKNITVNFEVLGFYRTRKKLKLKTIFWSSLTNLRMGENILVIFGQRQCLNINVWSSHDLVKLLMFSVFFIRSTCNNKFSQLFLVITNYIAAVLCSSNMVSLAEAGLGFWLTGKLGRAWVGEWVVHGWCSQSLDKPKLF